MVRPVAKEADERTEVVRDTVRETKLDVDKEGAAPRYARHPLPQGLERGYNAVSSKLLSRTAG